MKNRYICTLFNHKNTVMVSNFNYKGIIILRNLLLTTVILPFLMSSSWALDAKNFSSKNSVEFSKSAVLSMDSWQQVSDFIGNLPEKPQKFTVVIDAGHGGHDPGASGKNSVEKELTLQMALKLEKMLKTQLPEVEVLMTRTTDDFIPLFSRIQYANDKRADLFISIHCNYLSNPKIGGTETYVMGLHRAEENLQVAKRENASILLEHNYEANYDGYDPNSLEGHIMMSMYQNSYLDKSIEFAASVENEFKKTHVSRSKGVKQAGFAVLRRASMPAVLVEAGFLSNAKDEKFLLSEDGQQKVVTSIFNAIQTFYNDNKNNDFREVASEEAVKAAIDDARKKNEETSLPTNYSADATSGIDYIFKVQIAAFKNDMVDMDSEELRQIGTLSVMKQNGINKYLVGDFVTRSSAEVAREKLKNLGYKGAFIVVLDR